MKNKSAFTIALTFGVFLLVNTTLMAQSSGVTVVAEEREREREHEREEAAHVAREYGESYVYSTGRSSEKNSKLTLSKDYDGESSKKTGTFSVESGVHKIRLTIHGSVKTGKINIEVYFPGNKELKKLTIDDTADITWSQTINIAGPDENNYYGEYTYVIDAQNVKGHYTLSLSTF